MTEDYFFDYNLVASQARGGDFRLDIYIFFYYNMLGYVIYGISDDIDTYFCDDIFKHKNYLGLSNKVKEVNRVFNRKYSRTLIKRGSEPFQLNLKSEGRKVNNVLFDTSDDFNNFLTFKNKYNILYKKKYIYNIFFSNKNIVKLLFNRNLLKDSNVKYYFNFNRDRSFI
jgi:hypothetical protein